MISITIDSVNRDVDIQQFSVRYSQRLSNEPATLDFAMEAISSPPPVGAEVILDVDGTRVFKGTITERADAISSGSMHVSYQYRCVDGFYELDRRLVIKAYENSTVKDVVEDILANYTSGFTLTAPTITANVSTVRFNYEEPSSCIQKLCDAAGYSWYIDPFDVVTIFPSSDVPAPFEVNEVDGHVLARSIAFDGNISELKNVIRVRGGSYKDPINEADAIDKYESNGEDNTFPLVYQYSETNVTVNGAPQSIGIDYIHDPALFDCLYNYSEKLIRFPNGTLTSGDIVRVFGNAAIPLLVEVTDGDSIAAYGEREAVEVKKSIDSVSEAQAFAKAILNKWREGSREGSFKSYKGGWRVGQSVTVNSTAHSVNEDYKINRVTASLNTHNEFIYSLEFIKSGQTTFSDLIISLFGKERDNLSISANEVLQKFADIEETFSISDSIEDVVKDTPNYQYAGVASDTYNFSTYA